MQKITCHFDKAQYLPGEPVRLILPENSASPSVTFFRMERETELRAVWQDGALVLTDVPPGGYGVRVSTLDGVWEGAFDVVSDRRAEIRYGFLSDFSPLDTDTADVEWMRDLHLNAVQFYDWMYRHDRLLPPGERYDDPMGRPTDLRVITKKIEACKSCGIRPLAYGAVYAATKDTFEAHPEWGMYTMDAQPMTFAGWLYYMNIAPSCGWAAHIVEEFRSAVRFGFSGIHMDTYGFPKRVWDAQRRPVELADEFPRLIHAAAQAVREEAPDGGVIFNAVNNWPTEAVAGTEQDAVYIEVWPPHDTYFDLYRLIREARLLSHRNVILAAYLKAFQTADMPAAERSFRLAWAVISASGGTQLVLGEDRSLLRDSYYVNYARLRESFLSTVQRCCDFLVRYKDLLYNDPGMDISKTASGGINEDVRFFSDGCTFSTDGQTDTVWTILRESRERLTLHLVNLTGNNALWNEGKREPVPAAGISAAIRLDRPVRGIYCASPDDETLAAQSLPYTAEQTEAGCIYTVKLPDVRYWTAVWVQLEDR